MIINLLNLLKIKHNYPQEYLKNCMKLKKFSLKKNNYKQLNYRQIIIISIQILSKKLLQIIVKKYQIKNKKKIKNPSLDVHKVVKFFCQLKKILFNQNKNKKIKIFNQRQHKNKSLFNKILQ